MISIVYGSKCIIIVTKYIVKSLDIGTGTQVKDINIDLNGDHIRFILDTDLNNTFISAFVEFLVNWMQRLKQIK